MNGKLQVRLHILFVSLRKQIKMLKQMNSDMRARKEHMGNVMEVESAAGKRTMHARKSKT